MLFAGLALMIGGLVLAGLSVFVLPALGAMGIALMGLFGVAFVVGLIITGTVLVAGIRKNSSSRAPVVYRGVKVIARYAIDWRGQTLFDEAYMDPEDTKLKYYVRLQIPGREATEYRCSAPVWGQCGELLTGTASIQGDWIGRFDRDALAGPSR